MPTAAGVATVDASVVAKGLYVASITEGSRTYKQKLMIVE